MDNGKKKGNETTTELSVSPGSALGHTQSSERELSASSGERDALAPNLGHRGTEGAKESAGQATTSSPCISAWLFILSGPPQSHQAHHLSFASHTVVRARGSPNSSSILAPNTGCGRRWSLGSRTQRMVLKPQVWLILEHEATGQFLNLLFNLSSWNTLII